MEYKRIKEIMDEFDIFNANDLEEALKTSRKYFGILFKYEVYNTYALEEILKAYRKYARG